MIEQQTTDQTLDLDHLEKLNALRTPGEWSTDADADNPPHVIFDEDGEVLTYYKPDQPDGDSWGGFESADDARFVVALVNAAPQLLAELRRLRTLEAAGLQGFVDRVSGDNAAELATERAGVAALRAVASEVAEWLRNLDHNYRRGRAQPPGFGSTLHRLSQELTTACATNAGADWLTWARDALALIREHLVSDDECRCTEEFFRAEGDGQRCTHCRGQVLVKRAERLGIGPKGDQPVQTERPRAEQLIDLLQRVESLEQTSKLLVQIARGQLATCVALEQIAYADADAVSHSQVASKMRDLAREALKEIAGGQRHYLGLVAHFATRMESLLYENDATKGRFGWRGCKPGDLEPKLREEIGELVVAISEGNPEEIAREAADVANLCAMIADVAGGESGIGGADATASQTD